MRAHVRASVCVGCVSVWRGNERMQFNEENEFQMVCNGFCSAFWLTISSALRYALLNVSYALGRPKTMKRSSGVARHLLFVGEGWQIDSLHWQIDFTSRRCMGGGADIALTTSPLLRHCMFNGIDLYCNGILLASFGLLYCAFSVFVFPIAWRLICDSGID